MRENEGNRLTSQILYDIMGQINGGRSTLMNNSHKTLCLDGAWHLFIEQHKKCAATAKTFTTLAALQATDFYSTTGTVPGNFELDLVRDGVLPDPFLGENPLILQQYENRHLWYATTFSSPAADGEDWVLKFDGIDTVADIYLNGELLGSTANMLISHEFPVSLRDGENELLVHITPSMIAARDIPLGAGINTHQFYNAAALGVRKAAHMYGWDIFPRIISGGIWKSVTLIRKPRNRIDDFMLATTRLEGNGNAILFAHYRITAEEDLIQRYTVHIHGECNDRTFNYDQKLWHTEETRYFIVAQPYLWWPRGMGNPNLYHVTVTLSLDDQAVDSQEFDFGIRTAGLVRSEMLDENGNGEFCFIVNGQKMFARGTNWVPLDPFHSRDTERLPKALQLLEESNVNMVRVWGGGVYESDAFYNFCDAHGITVWQDFAMGCASYPQDKEFCDKLREEAEQVVTRLRNHPAVFLWSGDNEGDQFIGGCLMPADPNKYAPTRTVLPDVLRRTDPSRPYLPSSPYMSPEAAKYGWGNQAKTLPERHLWGGNLYFKDPFFTKSICHFVSETGQHGCPSPSSVRRFINPDKLWPWQDNTEWQVHYTCMETTKDATYSRRIRNIIDPVSRVFGLEPNNLEDLALSSQIVQAEGLKFFMERARSLKFEKMTGMLIWNLLDGWPQFSDAVVDYYFSPKLAYHVLKRSQEPVCLLFREPKNGTMEVVCVNDTLKEIRFTYRIIDVTHDREVTTGDGCTAANVAAVVCSVPHSGDDTVVYLIEWTMAEGKTYRNHYISGSTPLNYDTVLDGYRKVGLLELYRK